MPKLIEFDNVSVEREGTMALRNVTFSIEAGEHVAILGPNGCGKSTLPKTLVLDEPANSLDVRAQGEMRDSMRKLADKGVSVIVVTHHLPDIIPEIRRVIALKQGRIFFDGKKQDLLTPERMEELFDVPV